jgi:hypothetical protein
MSGGHLYPGRTFARWLWVAALAVGVVSPRAAYAQGVQKLQDVTIYADARFHSAFPSIVRRPDGELLLAFRRAPDRRRLGDTSYTHTDPNSYLMLVRSRDDGRTWTKEPQLISAYAFGGSQDPCMVQLRDGTLVCTSYAWAWMPPTALPKLPQPNYVVGGRFVFLGGYLLRSMDGGASWSPPIVPPRSEGEQRVDMFGQPLPAYNRGAMCEGRDGRLYWVIASRAEPANPRSETHLMISEDKGATWKYSCPVARDAKAGFSETSIHETPKGDLVAFMRTSDLNDHLYVARSTDRGKSFSKWEDAGFQGHPAYALRLPDDRVLLVYGYRHPPFGIRARVLDPECTNLAAAPEVVLRDDGGGVDLGYPWATMVAKDRALVVYYFNRNDGTRTIEGTLVKVE